MMQKVKSMYFDAKPFYFLSKNLSSIVCYNNFMILQIKKCFLMEPANPLVLN